MRIFAAKLVMRGSYARAVVSPIETPNSDLEASADTNGDNVYELTDAASDGSLSDTQGAVGDGSRMSSAVSVLISVAEELDQLTALAFRHAANRLRGRDPAAAEEASGPRRTDLWHCEQEILNLGRLRVGGRPGENILDPHSPRSEFLLQGRSPAADLVRLPQGAQPLIEGLRRSSLAPLARHRGILGNPRLAAHLTRTLSFDF